MWILALNNADVSDNRQRVLLVDERVRCAPEHDVRDEALLLVRSRVLADWHSHGKVVVWQIRAKVLVCEHHIYAYDGILRILSSLHQRVHVDMLDGLQLGL